MKILSKYLTTVGVASILGLSTAATAATDLTMYYPVAVGGSLTKIVDGMVDKFEAQNPDINVNAIYAGNYNDARVKALAALQSGSPAQLSVMFSIDLHELRNLEAIVAFDDVVSTNEEREWLNSFYPALMENGKADGKTWGVPFQRSTIVMYYNKDMFRAAGLDPEMPPTSWEEFISMGKKLTTKDDSGTVQQWGAMIPSTGYPYWMFGALTKQNSEVLMNQEGTETYFDKPGVVEALEYWQDLGNKHAMMPKGMIEWGTLRQNFLDQKTAIMWHSTGNLTTVKNKANFDFGVAKLPGNKELAMLVHSLGLSAFSRADVLESTRVPFYLYVDEFQNFSTLAIVNLLSELRKYKLGVVLANQYLAQLENDIRDAVLGNVGTLISFRLGVVDARYMAKEFFPVFDFDDIARLPNYTIYLKLMIDGTPSRAFSAETLMRPKWATLQKPLF